MYRRRSSVAPASVPASPHAPLPGEPALHLTPKTLYDLGFQGRVINGVEVVIPPTCDVPAGPFTMGSDKARDPQAYDNETPQYMVETGAFQIGALPRHRRRVRLCRAGKAGRAASRTSTDRVEDPTPAARSPGGEHLVERCRGLRGVAGEGDAAGVAPADRGGVGEGGARHGWAHLSLGRRLRHGALQHQREQDRRDDARRAAYPTGASPYGAQDMAGNVWEWTSSLFTPYPYRKNDGREDQKSTDNRVLRGGSWDGDPRDARAAYRDDDAPGIPLRPHRVSSRSRGPCLSVINRCILDSDFCLMWW